MTAPERPAGAVSSPEAQSTGGGTEQARSGGPEGGTAPIYIEWPGHPHQPPHELTPEEIRELRAHAATERVATDGQRDGDLDLAAAPNDWLAVRTLRMLGLLHYPGGSCELLTAAGREVLARIEEGQATPAAASGDAAGAGRTQTEGES